MKKILLSALFAFALLATAGYRVNESMKNDAIFSDLTLSNVEALADGENGGSYSCGKYCKEDSDWTCKIYSNGVLMNTCPGIRKK